MAEELRKDELDQLLKDFDKMSSQKVRAGSTSIRMRAGGNVSKRRAGGTSIMRRPGAPLPHRPGATQIVRLASSTGTRGKRKRKQRKPQWLFLVAALLLLLAGAAHLTYLMLSEKEEAPVRKAPEAPVVLQSSNLAEALRSADFSKSLAVNGKEPKFVHPTELSLPKDGTPMKVYVLLRAELDPFTETRWKFDDMFEGEFQTSPFLRTVIVRNQDALDNLVDWHVEGVTLNLTPDEPEARKSK